MIGVRHVREGEVVPMGVAYHRNDGRVSWVGLTIPMSRTRTMAPTFCPYHPPERCCQVRAHRAWRLILCRARPHVLFERYDHWVEHVYPTSNDYTGA